ncbi:MAG: phytoene desaturase [Deltaproteobacteria bacterium]|nr:phytoene desaturase [Deltaproteobacteria bacterium]
MPTNLTPPRASHTIKKAAVVGSGFGGLAVAIRLAAAGVKTVIYEALPELGGRAGVFTQDGHVFDRGPTVVTAPDTITELFELAGKSMSNYVELMPVSPMYRLFWEDGTTFDYSAGEEDLMREIRRLSPEDVNGYQRYFRYAQEVFDEGYTKLCHVPFLNFWDMVKVAPQLIRLNAHVPVYSTVSKFFKSDYLRQAFSFNSLLIGGNPLRASSIYTLIHPLERKWGVYFPRGGTHALVRGLAKLFTDIGGEIRLGTPVKQILTKNGRISGVMDASGNKEDFDTVVSNADVVHTYDKLLGHEAAAAKKARRLKSKRHSMSLFLIYFGTNNAYPNLIHHNVMFGRRYQELLKDIFDRGVVSDDFSLYLHAPSLTDDSLAPPGKHTYYVLAPVPHLGHGAFDWKRNGESFADNIMAYLDEHYMPGLRDDLTVRKIFTPLDFQSRLSAHEGSAFSLEPTLTQSAYFRVHNADPQLPGLYFVGAGTHPGAGIPGVIGSAKATAGVILGAEAPAAAGALQPQPAGV